MKTAIWRILVSGLMALCLWSIPASHANTTNVAPFAQSFEELGYNESLISTQGWYGFSNLWAVATNVIPTGVLYPISGAHDKSIRLNTEFGSITNLIETNAIAVNASNIWIDCLMQFTQWTDDNPPDLTNTNDPAQINQIGLYVATGQLVIAHAFYTNNAAAGYTNRLTTITNLPPIGSQDWVRVTIFRALRASSNVKVPFYRVEINGTNAYDDNWAHYTNHSSTLGWVARAFQTGGVWFASMSPNLFTSKPFSNTVLSGTGYFDDFVVTNGQPRQQVSWLVQTALSPSHGGTITPTMIIDDLGTAVVNVATSAYWGHKYWTHNAASNTATTNYTITIDPVTNNNYITSYVAQVEVTNTDVGVTMPMWWLATYGLYSPPTSVNITNDLDLDGKLNWEEWLASTDPNDSNSVFQITKHYTTNGGDTVVEWITKAVDPALLSLPFRVDRSEDLTNGWITNYGSRQRSSGTTTNRWTNSAPPSAAFYRIVATN